MRFVTTRHVGYAGKLHDPDTPLTFREGDDAIRERLLELGAIAVDLSMPGAAEAEKAEADRIAAERAEAEKAEADRIAAERAEAEKAEADRIAAERAAANTPPPEDLGKATKPRLLEIADAEGVKVESDDNKADLVRKIQVHRATKQG